MQIRLARGSETWIGSKVIYQENPNDCSNNAPVATIKGQMPYSNGSEFGCNAYLFVIEMLYGQIILASSQQLFVGVK